MGAAEWPRHDNKAWQEVIDRARELGWPRPHWTTSHPTLVLECPERNPQCRIKAFSTGRGTEKVAKQALKSLERCPHRDVTDALSSVDDHLRVAERMITAAGTLVERGDLDSRLGELLHHASESLDTAERALAEEEFDKVAAERDALQPEVDVLPAETSPEDLLASASPPLRKARLELRDLPKRSSEVRRRRERLDDLTSQRNMLSDLLHDRT